MAYTSNFRRHGALAERIERQAEELDRLLTALIKRYQFRDRSTICCEGVTVSQCYVMKELGVHRTLTMSRLADLMCLTASTLTRVVDQLARKGYARRRPLPADRRVRCVELTERGHALLRRMEGMIRDSEREVLAQLPPPDREGLLRGLRALNAALEARARRGVCG